MNEAYDVVEAKSRFSELLSRAASGHERFLIRKRGKPVAAIVSTEDLARLMDEAESGSRTRRGLIAAAELLADLPEWEGFVRDAYESRQTSTDRTVELD